MLSIKSASSSRCSFHLSDIQESICHPYLPLSLLLSSSAHLVACGNHRELCRPISRVYLRSKTVQPKRASSDVTATRLAIDASPRSTTRASAYGMWLARQLRQLCSDPTGPQVMQILSGFPSKQIIVYNPYDRPLPKTKSSAP
jgi:hypothetical protein